MVMQMNITYNRDPRLASRAIFECAGEAVKETVKYWHTGFSRNHFESYADSRYRYKKRNERYLRQKENIKHHRRPLVWSGDTERATRQISITANKKEGKGRMKAPRYVWMSQHKKGSMPDMVAELLAVTDSEVKKMKDVYEKTFHKELDDRISVRRRMR